MITQFLFFKKNEDERFILGPKGFNNNETHSYANLTLWIFKNSESQAHFIESNGKLLAYFHEATELVDLLKGEGVNIIETQLGSDSINYDNAVIQCENGYSLHFRKGKKLCIDFSVQKGGKNIISHNFYCDSPQNESQKIDRLIASMFTEPYPFISESAPDENGNPPEWINELIDGKVVVKDKKDTTLVKIVLGIIIIIILALLAQNFM